MAVALEMAAGGIGLGVQLNRRAVIAQFPYSASSSCFFRARSLSSHSLVHDALCISSGARSAGEGAARLSIRSRAGSIAPPRSTLAESALPQKQESFTVGDYMTPRDELYVATVNTTVDEALEVLVDKRITGMPVVDDAGRLVGVVSDYDLLALDSISGKRVAETSLFPEAGRTWKAFKEIQKLLIKTNGQVIGDVMTPSPLVVRELTNLEDAARVLLDTKFRRLPVVDETGRLVGLLTRGNVVRAALTMKQAAEKAASGGT